MSIRKIWRAIVYRLCNLVWPVVSLFGSKAKFAFVYRMNLWGNPESASGDGSTMEYTANLRKMLPELFKRYGITKVIDAPCGDYNWFRHVAREDVSYLGGDIVNSLVNENRRKYGDALTDFLFFDISNSTFPSVDLWICRDCMFHLPTRDVKAALENFSQSGVDYILATSHIDTKENIDLPRTGFRMLNLELPPYNLPTPEYSIDDWIPGFPRRIMGLWRREDVVEAVANWNQEIE